MCIYIYVIYTHIHDIIIYMTRNMYRYVYTPLYTYVGTYVQKPLVIQTIGCTNQLLPYGYLACIAYVQC